MEIGRPKEYLTEEESKQRYRNNSLRCYYKYHELNKKRERVRYYSKLLQQAREEGKDETEIMNKLRWFNKEVNRLKQEAKNKN